MEWLALAPPLAAIAVAVAARHVYAALGLALWLSETLRRMGVGAAPEEQSSAITALAVAPFLGVLDAIDRAVGVFESPGNTRILLFCLLVGVLIAYMRDSGGVAALARALSRGGLADSRRKASVAVAGVGTAIFVDTNASLLSAGVLGRSLFDAHQLSRARLAYIIDSTCAPVSVLMLINGWGAFALALIAPYGFDNPVGVVAGTLAWNFYAWLTLAGVYATAFSDRVFGPLARFEAQTPAAQRRADGGPTPTRARYMWVPMLVMVGGAVAFMMWTGGGNPMAGSGAQSMLWAVSAAVVVSAVMLAREGVFSPAALQQKAFAGLSEMLPAVLVLFLSMSLGDSLRALGTGDVAAALMGQALPPAAIPALLFIASGAAAFMTGTSWGTYAVMAPIAMPLAAALGLPPSLVLAAVLGGGVFGDHCSPISDTTLVASIASGSDHLTHVRTQLPYALATAALAIVGYGVAGVWATL